MKRRIQRKAGRAFLVALLFSGFTACGTQGIGPKIVPSVEYSRRLHEGGLPVHGDSTYGHSGTAAALPGPQGEELAQYVAPERTQMASMANAPLEEQGRAGLRYVNENGSMDPAEAAPYPQQGDVVSNMDLPSSATPPAADMYVERSRDPLATGYRRGLEFGDPGVSASLWRESQSGTNIYRDHRAFQPMDLITILVTENAEGKKEADTEIKQESSILAGISSFFNVEKSVEASNKGLETSNLIEANTQNDFKGEGETNRKGSLTATISAMVAEVLPSGILRVEGEKIISVNNEEQIMVISGLVRPRDISSTNEVDSQKIANMRIDYFGRGTLGEAQIGGWLSRVIRVVWPF